AHAAILLAPPVERQFGNADLANGIRHRHALAAQNLNLPKLRDDLVGLRSLVGHCGPPSWSKPYFKVDPSNGGGSGLPEGRAHAAATTKEPSKWPRRVTAPRATQWPNWKPVRVSRSTWRS